MGSFKLLYFVIFIIKLYLIEAQISDKRLCVDKECTVPISKAKTVSKYPSPHEKILSFLPNEEVIIYSKSAGKELNLWGAEIKGKRGYVPKNLIREIMVINKPTLLVATELSSSDESLLSSSSSEQSDNKVEPNKVIEPYEVHDGTTFYLNPEEIIPSSTEPPVLATDVPPNSVNLSGFVTPPTEPLIKEEATKQEGIESKQTEENSLNSAEINSTIISGEEDEDAENDADDEDDEDDVQISDEEEEDVLIQEEQQPTDKATVTETEPLQQNKQEENKEAPPPLDLDTQQQQNIDNTTEEQTNYIKKVNETEQIVAEVTTPEVQEKNDIKAGNTPIKPPLFGNLPKVQENLPEEIKLPLFGETTVQPPKIQEKILEQEEIIAPSQGKLPLFKELPKNIKIEEEEVIKEDKLKEPPLQLDEPPKVQDEIKLEQTSNELNFSAELSTEQNSPPTEAPVSFDIPQPLEDNSFESVTTPDPFKLEELDEYTNFSLLATKEDDDLVSSKTDVDLGNHESTEQTISSSNEEIQANKLEEQTNNEEEQEALSPSSDSGGLLDSVYSFFGSSTDNNRSSNEAEETVETVTPEEPPVVTPEEPPVVTSEEPPVVSPEEPSVVTPEESAEVTLEEQNIPQENLWAATLNVEKENHEPTTSPVSEKTPDYCLENPTASDCQITDNFYNLDLFSSLNSNVFLYLVTTAISVLLFLLGYITIDKGKREGPLIRKINKLENELLVQAKENEILNEKLAGTSIENLINTVPNEVVEELKTELENLRTVKEMLEEQVQSLEKELENSTEVGMELNRMLSDILSSQNGSDTLLANVEQLQRQLVEQQTTINSVNESLNSKHTENHELHLELDIANKKVMELQTELDKLVLNMLKIEEEKETIQNNLETDLSSFKLKYENTQLNLSKKEDAFKKDLQKLQAELNETQRKLELKSKEYDSLKETIKAAKGAKNNAETLKSLIDSSAIKAQLEQFKHENGTYIEKLQQEQDNRYGLERKIQSVNEELYRLKERYDLIDKEKVEAQTKLEVLSNYFKEKEAQLQKELSKQESMWVEKQGEATSTIERIKYMQDELQNYKAQNESLKQEIISQEVELKSQISVLEKKVHENWMNARHAERRYEESKQEAAQLRNRLTLRERALNVEDRMLSPLEQNGELPLHHIESPASPPLIYGGREHLTKSPPLPGMPPPFLPPPPFMAPPMPGHHHPPMFPPPPSMFPGDHRPPPLGRMSSPPLNSRYSPDSRAYSPYDRNSPSPSYDSEYGTSPPTRGYSPYNDKDDRRDRDYKRGGPFNRSNGRNLKGSSSGNSNESLEKINRKQQHSKV